MVATPVFARQSRPCSCIPSGGVAPTDIFRPAAGRILARAQHGALFRGGRRRRQRGTADDRQHGDRKAHMQLRARGKSECHDRCLLGLLRTPKSGTQGWVAPDRAKVQALRRYRGRLVSAFSHAECGLPLRAQKVLTWGELNLLAREVRLARLLREISACFTDPDFSAQKLARQKSVTDLYVQDLLHECGSSFSERVLELRLQRARVMVEDCRYDRLRIGEIANASGFNRSLISTAISGGASAQRRPSFAAGGCPDQTVGRRLMRDRAGALLPAG